MKKAVNAVLNKNTMLELVGDDPELIQQFQIDFLKQAQESLPQLVALFQQQEFNQIKELAHFLKTSAKAIGAEVVANLLQKLEYSALEHDIKECKQFIVQTNVAVKQLHGVIISEQQ